METYLSVGVEGDPDDLVERLSVGGNEFQVEAARRSVGVGERVDRHGEAEDFSGHGRDARQPPRHLRRTRRRLRKKNPKKRHHQKRFEGTDRSNTWIDIDRKNPFNLRLDSILTRSALNSLKMVASLITQQKRIRTMPREIHLKPWHYFKGSRRKRGGGFGWEINES